MSYRLIVNQFVKFFPEIKFWLEGQKKYEDTLRLECRSEW